MEVRRLRQPGNRANPFNAALAKLIACVGFSAFESEMFCAARIAFDCEHLAAFVGDEDGFHLVMAADAAGSRLAREVGATFAASFWSRESAARLSQTLKPGQGLILRLDEGELQACELRRQCYESKDWQEIGSGFVERVSLIVRREHRLVAFTLLRGSRQRAFSAGLDLLADASDVLASLIERHSITTFSERHNAFRAHAAALSAMHPELPRREAEVGAGIVLGFTTEALALTLDISENTVRTYRKRVYARLKISSQNELMRIVLPQLVCDAERMRTTGTPSQVCRDGF